MAYLLAALVAAMALIITPGQLFYFDVTPKVIVLLAGVAVALLWKPAGRAPRWFSWLLILSFASAAISTAASANKGISAFGTNWRRFGLVEQAAILVLAWLTAAHIADRSERVM